MSVIDCRGLTHSGHEGSAMALLDDALNQLMRFKGDPLKLAKEAQAIDPSLMPARLLQAHTLAFSLHPAFIPKAHELLNQAKQLGGNERERAHVVAIEHWLGGRFDRAADTLGQIVTDWPLDLLAMMFVHQADFFSGAGAILLKRPMGVLANTPTDMPGRGFVMGMAAFGHEEAKGYEHAQDMAQAALAVDAQDVWAIHAMGHVLEMQGHDEAGIAWYRDRETIWAQECVFACHNWWHVALYHVDRLEFDLALAIFDQALLPTKRSITLNLSDAASLLWRIQLGGGDIGARMESIADQFARQSLGDVHIFNDVHAALSFAATNRAQDLAQLTQKLETQARQQTRYGQMAKTVGLPAIHAFQAFAAGQFAEAAQGLGQLMAQEHLMTGSIAQRELLLLTLIEAQLQAGHKIDAAAHIHSKLRAKSDSPFWLTTARRC